MHGALLLLHDAKRVIARCHASRCLAATLVELPESTELENRALTLRNPVGVFDIFCDASLRPATTYGRLEARRLHLNILIHVHSLLINIPVRSQPHI